MADKAEKKSDASSAGADKKDAAKKPGSPLDKPLGAAAGAGGAAGMLGKTPVLLGGVMLVEAIVLFAGFKFLGGGHPQQASGSELVTESSGERGEGGEGKSGGGDKRKVMELEVLSFRAPNKLSGRTFLYDVSIYVVAKSENEKRIKETIEARKALITDRIRTIIAQTDPEKLGGGSEPGLETLRRQVKYQLDQIVGDGLIDEVLVPRCIPFRTEY
jgi:flagellar basal body-associated protein FliL